MRQMGTGGDFRHDPAKGRVLCLLAENRFGKDAAIRTHHRRRGFITAAFQAKDQRIGLHACPIPRAGRRAIPGRVMAGLV